MEAEGSCSPATWAVPKKPLGAFLGKKMWAQDAACCCGSLGGRGWGARGRWQSRLAWMVTSDLKGCVCARAGTGHPAKLEGNAEVLAAGSWAGLGPWDSCWWSPQPPRAPPGSYGRSAALVDFGGSWGRTQEGGTQCGGCCLLAEVSEDLPCLQQAQTKPWIPTNLWLPSIHKLKGRSLL